MKTIDKDFAAYKARLQTHGTAHYERREDPGASQMADVLDKITKGVETWKSKHEQQMLDVRGQVDKIETRMLRPGAFTGSGPAPDDDSPTLIDVTTGKPLVTIKSGDDIERKYRDAGLFKPEHEELKGLKLGDFLRAVAGQNSSDLARKALSVGTDAAGGHLVPALLMPGVLAALVPQSAVLRAGAKMIPIEMQNGGAKTYTWAAVNAIPIAAWRAEAGTVAESDPTFRTIVATPRSLAFFFKVSRELLADAANLDQVLPTIIAQAFAKELDRVALLGTGTAPEPRGIKNTASIQTVTNGANGASLATLRYANLLSAVQAILQADGPMPTAAIMAPRSLVGFASLADTTNQPLRAPELLSRLRMLATSQLPTNITTGSSTDTTEMFVGDFTNTSYVMREVMSIQRLGELFAGTGQVGFMAHARVDFICEYPVTLAYISGVRP